MGYFHSFFWCQDWLRIGGLDTILSLSEGEQIESFQGSPIYLNWVLIGVSG